jgi:hypothetical protein
MPAAAVVETARRGHVMMGTRDRTSPLSERAATAAETITVTVASALHRALTDDATYQEDHTTARARAQIAWDTKFSHDEKLTMVAEQAQVMSHQGLEYERQAGTYGAHEEEVIKLLQSHHLRQDPDKAAAEAEHEEHLAATLLATGNLGLIPNEQVGQDLIRNISRSLLHRSHLVARAAADALRNHYHPHSENALRSVITKPLTRKTRDLSTKALETLATWPTVDRATLSHVLGELAVTPYHSVRDCERSCRARQRAHPHRLHHGDALRECNMGCRHGAERSRLLVTLAEKAAANGHDLQAIISQDHGISVSVTGDHAERGHARFSRADAEAQTNGQGNQRARRLFDVPDTLEKGANVRVAKQLGRGVTAGIVSTALCYIPAFEKRCIGVDLVLGHSPIAKRNTYPLGKIPIVGEVGIESALVLANLVWGRASLFETGFGERVEPTSKVFIQVQIRM